ncbi:unnamed protein product [Lactuca virosa]|uniref:DUF668 domain-containing protein n=1 Tax=Lactuca virosa TaxID=75947 RepID=A0AAU9NDW8_9ASTR|nr:unnamed protein product [Lactuca virosa]
MFRGKFDVVKVLDTLGSNMKKVDIPNTISILAFEVANTIVKGYNLMQSLSEENIQIFLKEILYSEGVQLLVSTDIKELLSIANADKREEFEVFLKEVVRFGNRSRDAQLHQLNRYFSRLRLEPIKTKHLQKEVEIAMQELTNLAQYTYELFHELHALERSENLYSCKIEEVESQNLPRKGKSLMVLQSELKNQRKLVSNLKKKSLWSKNLEEVMYKLVDVVTFIHCVIVDSFEENVERKKANKKTERLGIHGLALHYANLITQMDIIASRSICVLPNMRDKLYNDLPASVKAGLRYRLRDLDSKEVMTMTQIKAEMEKVLQWLIPIAIDTVKAHHCFGCVGEWTKTGNEFRKKTSTGNNIIRLQTLYHADKQKMDRTGFLGVIQLFSRHFVLYRRSPIPQYDKEVDPYEGLFVYEHTKILRIKEQPEDPHQIDAYLVMVSDI